MLLPYQVGFILFFKFRIRNWLLFVPSQMNKNSIVIWETIDRWTFIVLKLSQNFESNALFDVWNNSCQEQEMIPDNVRYCTVQWVQYVSCYQVPGEGGWWRQRYILTLWLPVSMIVTWSLRSPQRVLNDVSVYSLVCSYWFLNCGKFKSVLDLVILQEPPTSR